MWQELKDSYQKAFAELEETSKKEIEVAENKKNIWEYCYLRVKNALIVKKARKTLKNIKNNREQENRPQKLEFKEGGLITIVVVCTALLTLVLAPGLLENSLIWGFLIGVWVAILLWIGINTTDYVRKAYSILQNALHLQKVDRYINNSQTQPGLKPTAVKEADQGEETEDQNGNEQEGQLPFNESNEKNKEPLDSSPKNVRFIGKKLLVQLAPSSITKTPNKENLAAEPTMTKDDLLSLAAALSPQAALWGTILALGEEVAEFHVGDHILFSTMGAHWVGSEDSGLCFISAVGPIFVSASEKDPYVRAGFYA